jgi:hypothetical protein
MKFLSHNLEGRDHIIHLKHRRTNNIIMSLSEIEFETGNMIQ